MLNKILPSWLSELLNSYLNIEWLNELRVRAERPLVILYHGKYHYLGKNGITADKLLAIKCDMRLVNDIIFSASEYSIFSITKQLSEGYITTQNGLRIGICGEIVWENDKIKTIKNFSSLVIRIPHEIFGCADKIYPLLLDNPIKNTLIISPPACGKTTILRELCRLISQNTSICNVLIVDERLELSACYEGRPLLDVGENSDIISLCDKSFGFKQAIRSMSPQVVATDEIITQADCDAIEYVVHCGVKALSSIHAKNISELKVKPYFKDLLAKKIFERYVLLSNNSGIGTIEGVFDDNLLKIM